MAKPSKKVMEKLKKYREKLKSGGNWFKLKDGESKIVRVLPAKDPEDFFFKEVGQHYLNGQYYTCPKITDGEPCPICEMAEELRESSEKEDQKLAKEFSASRKWVIILVDRSDAKPTIRPYRAPKSIIDVLTRDFLDEDYEDILDPFEGRDYKFEREGSGKSSEYDASPRPKTSPLLPKADEDEVKEFLDNAPDLDSFVDVPDYDDLQKALEGEEDPDDKDDTKPSKDDDDDDTGGDDDEQEDKKSSSKSKGSSKSDLKSRIKSKLAKGKK